MRIAPAIGTALALVAVAAPTTPAHSSEARSVSTSQESSRPSATHRTASRGDKMDVNASTPGASFVRVSWHWIRAASGYRIQVAKDADFTKVVTARKKRNSNKRPAGGRATAVVGGLRDATYYWVRVRKVVGSHKSSWSSAERVGTKAKMPDRITRAVGGPGPAPGTTKIKWTSDGGHTDFFRITTALTPFGNASTPKEGRHSTTFRVSGDQRSLTLSPEQTAAAGAALGTGHHLFFRITAVRAGEADRAVRPYQHLRSTTVAGQSSPGSNSPLRFASYNLHTASKDVPGHPWRDRASWVAENLARANPAVVALQEMLPNMWDTRAGGIGLKAALSNAGMGRYRLTRDSAYGDSPGDSRILYDPNQVQMTSSCDPDADTCAIKMPDPDGRVRLAAYARFQDLSSGQEFWFVSAHLNPGNDAKTDEVRGRQAQAVVDAMRSINTQHLPIVVGADLNSSQTSNGKDAPHSAFLQAGYYNTSAAETQINLEYNSVNAYETPEKPSNYGFGSMIDSIMTLGMPGADVFKQWLTGAPYPTDHNLITADVRLP
jgi:endonuclease/exonuclease/phosphatase family metal-dependent hydrolase